MVQLVARGGGSQLEQYNTLLLSILMNEGLKVMPCRVFWALVKSGRRQRKVRSFFMLQISAGMESFEMRKVSEKQIFGSLLHDQII